MTCSDVNCVDVASSSERAVYGMHALVKLTQNAVDSELCYVITVDNDDIMERCTVVRVTAA